jgi:hypothetical protein
MRRFMSKLLPLSLSSKSPARPAKRRPHTSLGLETLENRLVPAFTLANVNGSIVLSIRGTANDDVIELVSPTAGSMQSFLNGRPDFPLTSTRIDRVEIDAAGGSSDQVLISGVQSNVTGRVNVINAEDVTVGQQVADNRFSMANIRSQVSVGVPVDGTLSVRNNADPTARIVNVRSDRVEGFPVTVFYGLAPGARTRLNLTTGDGNDTINVLSTPPAGAIGVTISTNGGKDTFNVEGNTSILRLNGGADDDTFNMAPTSQNLSTLDRQVLIQGGTGANSLVVNDQSRSTAGFVYDATLADETIGSAIQISVVFIEGGPVDQATVRYDDVQSVQFFAPTGFFHVLSTAPGVNTVIANFAARVDIGNAGSLDGIQGPLTINRADLIVFDDSAQTTPQHYDIQANSENQTSSVDRGGMATVTFGDFTSLIPSTVRLEAGHANDGFTVRSLRGGNGTYVLDGHGGNNALAGPDTNNLWEVTDLDAGRLNTRVNFQNVGGLQGGAKDDHFRLSDQKGVTGFISGQPILIVLPDVAFDTIDYSQWTTAVGGANNGVIVNLAEQRGRNVAFGTAGRLTGMDAIFGSQLNDTLTGDGGANVILGLGGDDTIDGGGGKGILIGGLGADTITNGNFETIIVAGNTANGSISFGRVASITTPDAMKALHDEWTRTDLSYQQRVDHIRNGGGLNGSVKLNSATIHDDNAADIIHAGTALDLIFLHSGDLFAANPLQTAQEIVNL